MRRPRGFQKGTLGKIWGPMEALRYTNWRVIPKGIKMGWGCNVNHLSLVCFLFHDFGIVSLFVEIKIRDERHPLI